MSTRARLPFIDHFKCAGIAVIVYGHAAGWAPFATYPPIYLKQLGVAFFLWVLGYSLAREVRTVREVLFNRLFDVYVFGIAVALLVSAEGLLTYGKWAPGNYAPFVLGANLAFNDFPANPSTWYIGTYIHFLLAWAIVFRRVRVTLWVCVAALGFEVVVRAMLLQYAGNFIAYMAMPNWISVFLVGCYMGQRGITSVRGPAWAWAAGLVAAGSTWWWVAARVPLAGTFPFMTPMQPAIVATVGVSCAVSAVYLGATLLAFAVFSKMQASRVATFIAQNTLIVFIAHMPVVYWILRVLPDPAVSRWTSGVLVLVCLPGLAVVSHAVRGTSAVAALRAWSRRRLVDRPTASPAPVPAVTV